jgi:hypothetical protein
MAKTPISFRNQPAGCRFGDNPVGKMMPVFLDDMVATGSRAQRRWAKKQLLRKAGKK